MLRIHKAIASVGGIGYIKGGGTIAAAVVCVGLYLGIMFQIDTEVPLLLFSLVSFVVGVYTASRVEPDWGKDSRRVVIDEVQGMTVSLLFLPITVYTILAGFVLFRVFDIWKPLYIRRTERFPGGWGVMLDDVAAGIYANIVLQIAIRLL